MSFPNAKELARVRKKLEKVEPTQLLECGRFSRVDVA